MQPLICFYKNQQFIHSLDYQIISCDDDESTISFLKKMESESFSKMKILKINYSALEEKALIDRRDQYVKTPKAQVFILNTFELLTQHQLENIYPENSQIRPEYTPIVSEISFLENVRSIKDDICQGRFYQINYTAPLKAECSDKYSLLNEFIHSSKKVGSDYRAFLPLGHQENILCLSPEMFLQKTGSRLFTQPIKGTLSRGLAQSELENSTKENAELSMIVDLLRNDLNALSCSEYKDTSHVNFHRKILDIQYALHTYSEIEINTSKNLSEIIEKTFPGGSISGCPKKESLIKISETENFHRDFYTGSIGWWHEGDFCLNIAIRSIYQNHRNLFYFTGCGIVFDSDPRREWQEFLTKASFLNLSLNFSPIVDTLAFSDSNFTYLEEHIERTYLAFRSQMIAIEKNDMQNIYQKILADVLKSTKKSDRFKVRLIFYKDLTYEIELSLIEDKDIVKLDLAATRQFLPQFKTLDRSTWNSLLKYKNPEADDLLIVNTQGMIVETSIYSLFYKQNEHFFTPPLSDGGLMSVFRSHHLKKGEISVDGQIYSLSEKSLSLSDLKTVDLYVGNSVRGLKKAVLI